VVLLSTSILRRVTLLGAGLVALAAFMGTAVTPARTSDPFKIGVILPLTGPFESTGKQISDGMRLYIAQHGDVVAGRKIELLFRDDAGVASSTRRLSQEAVTQDHVNALFGYGLTPLAVAAAPISAEAKIPQIIYAATSSINQASPYIVRTSHTLAQVASVLGEWAAKQKVKTFVTLVSDYGPGAESETWFSKTYEANGGSVIGKIRVPLANPDFAPFLQRVTDLKPEALFSFVPSGVGAIMMRQFVERGLDKAGIRVIVTGDVVNDDILNQMGDAAVGVTSAAVYSAAHPSALNKEFVEAFHAAYGIRADFMAVSAYDGMRCLYEALKKTDGDADGIKLLEAMKGDSWESPRGMVKLDPETRDLVQDVYLRRTEKVNGELWNVEFDKVSAVRDPTR
jgi:branched-chain amino acid transport system substrate-binding protein